MVLLPQSNVLDILSFSVSARLRPLKIYHLLIKYALPHPDY